MIIVLIFFSDKQGDSDEDDEGLEDLSDLSDEEAVDDSEEDDSGDLYVSEMSYGWLCLGLDIQYIHFRTTPIPFICSPFLPLSQMVTRKSPRLLKAKHQRRC